MPTATEISAATDVALKLRTGNKTIASRLSAVLAALWASVDLDFPLESWAGRLPNAVGAFAAAQEAAAAMADPFLVEAMAAQGRTVEAAGGVVPTAFAGRAATGLPLELLLSLPVLRARDALDRGAIRSDVRAGVAGSLQMYAQTEVADAGRLSVQASTVAHRVGGYIRVVGPYCCKRCGILSGRHYRWSSGFKRHPNCFPAGVVVSSPGTQAVLKRWYEGELVIITTADGQELPTTVNHPVLTSRGWVPAGLLNEGDDVVRSLGGHVAPLAASAEEVPHKDHVPALIEDLWSSHSVLPIDSMPVAPHDFHGDGFDSEVDVVSTNGLLRDDLATPFFEPHTERALVIGDVGVIGVVSGGGLAPFGASRQLLEISNDSTDGPTGPFRTLGGLGRGRENCKALGLASGRFAIHPQVGGLLEVPHWNPGLAESLTEGHGVHAIARSEGRSALAVDVGLQRLKGESLDLPRWDAPAGPLSIDTHAAYAERGSDLRDRLTGQVKLDRVIHLRRVSFSGHVYNLTSNEGWYSANGLIVSNCNCVNLPVPRIDQSQIESPEDLYAQGRITDLSSAERKALDLGADISQVVNARRGMYVADDGREFTTEGTTRRGVAGARILARDIARAEGSAPGALYRNFTISKAEVAMAQAKYGPLMRKGMPFRRQTAAGPQILHYRFTRSQRASVSTILATATSQEDAVRMLINHGFIL